MGILEHPHTKYQTVGEIVATNPLRIKADASAFSVVVAFLSTHTSGAPVVSEQGQYLGFISEFDLLTALETGKDLTATKAHEIMTKDGIVVKSSTRLMRR